MSVSVILGSPHVTDRERIYDFRCKCGRAGVRRSRTRLVRVTCRDCGADVEWWQSRPIEPFVKPELPPELAAIPQTVIDEIRADRWSHLSRIAVVAVVGPEGGEGAIEGNAPHVASATWPECSTAAIREAAKAEVTDAREQLTLGEMFMPKPEGGGGI